MKKFLWGLMSIFMLISCNDKDDFIEFEKDYLEVDYHAQKVILKTDNIIIGVAFDLSESDTEEWDESFTGNCWICTGDWFSIVLKGTASRRIEVNIQENTTDQDRKVVVWVHRDIGSDTATIIQKAKPTE